MRAVEIEEADGRRRRRCRVRRAGGLVEESRASGRVEQREQARVGREDGAQVRGEPPFEARACVLERAFRLSHRLFGYCIFLN